MAHARVAAMIPDTPGLPLWWWLSWFLGSFVLDGILAWWFIRYVRREDRAMLRDIAHREDQRRVTASPEE